MFSRLYLDLAEQEPFFIRENGPQPQTTPHKPRRVNEDVVKAVWLEQPWGANPIRDVIGRRVEILSPGWLNGGPGPDFKNAVYRIDGGPQTIGDVEIHVRSSDWTRHGHHNDPAYDGVGLHVALYLDVKGIGKRTRSGEPVVEIELAPVCLSAIDRIRAQTPLEPGAVNLTMITGRCGEALGKLGAEKAMTLIEAAGEGRCDLKSRRYAEAMRRGDGARELYEGIMESMGYRVFKPHFLRLAKSAGPDQLKTLLDGVSWRDRRVVLQGTLLGMGGLLPDASVGSNNDNGETAAYLGRLNEAWRHAESLGLKAEIAPTEWKLAGTRPANYPAGRLAGAACFLSSHIDGDLETLFARALDGPIENGDNVSARGAMEKIEKLFETPPDEYMSTHYTIGGKKLGKPRKLIGAERIGVMMANVIIPYMLARARRMLSVAEEERIRKIYHALPPGPPNSVVKFMAERLSGAFSVKELTAKTPRQQGLIQIYNDYCLGSARGCGECGFFRYAGRLR